MELCNKNATKRAIRLYRELVDIRGKGIITGQHTQDVACCEIEYLRDITGKEPKLRGYEMLSYSPNINYEASGFECLDEVYQNRHTMEEAIKWGRKEDSMVTLSFHWFSPIGGSDKAFYSEHTDFMPSKILKDGSAEQKAFMSDLDHVSDILKDFKDNDVPVLWRPFHECDGTWFWWGREGAEITRELYLMMFDIFVNEKHLDNLIWVWNSKDKNAYPGDDHTDVVSVDIYPDKYVPSDYAKEYEELVAGTSCDKVAALAEVGYIPDIGLLKKSRVPWSYFMSWSNEWIIGEKYNKRAAVKALYNDEYAVNAREI